VWEEGAWECGLKFGGDPSNREEGIVCKQIVLTTRVRLRDKIVSND
jgi:hypothetical protein